MTAWLEIVRTQPFQPDCITTLSNMAVCGTGNNEEATPEAYAQTVVVHSHRTKESSLFPGQNFKALAGFLTRSNKNAHLQSEYNKTRQDDDFTFVSLHDYTADGKRNISYHDSGLGGRKKLSSQGLPGSGCAQLVFIRGYALPEWLNLIGSRYRVDPEFFRRHLNFLQPQTLFDIPNIPSASRNIIHLPLTTIVERTDGAIFRNRSFEADRQLDLDRVSSYLRQLDREAQIGRSIVRNWTTLDDKYSSLEQNVSVCVQPKGGGWVGKSPPSVDFRMSF